MEKPGIVHSVAKKTPVKIVKDPSSKAGKLKIKTAAEKKAVKKIEISVLNVKKPTVKKSVASEKPVAKKAPAKPTVKKSVASEKPVAKKAPAKPATKKPVTKKTK
jgi:hypothetical protein